MNLIHSDEFMELIEEHSDALANLGFSHENSLSLIRPMFASVVFVRKMLFLEIYFEMRDQLVIVHALDALGFQQRRAGENSPPSVLGPRILKRLRPDEPIWRPDPHESVRLQLKHAIELVTKCCDGVPDERVIELASNR